MVTDPWTDMYTYLKTLQIVDLEMTFEGFQNVISFLIW